MLKFVEIQHVSQYEASEEFPNLGQSVSGDDETAISLYFIVLFRYCMFILLCLFFILSGFLKSLHI